MAGNGIETKVDLTHTNRLIGNLSNMGKIKLSLKNLATGAIERNFKEGGRPQRWVKLSEITIQKRRKHSSIPLNNTGQLKGHIHATDLSERSFVVSTGLEEKDYAAILHFGGQAGRGLKVKIPARPYMVIVKEDWDEMQRTVKRMVLEGVTNE